MSALLKAFLALALLVVFLLPARAVDPEDQYLLIYSLVQEADSLSTGQPGRALLKYHEAQTALQKFQKTYPGWNSQLVATRLDYLASKINTMPATPPVEIENLTVGGMFPKMSSAAKAFVVDCQQDTREARMTAWALQGLVNHNSAEVYVLSHPWYREQLEFSRKPFEILAPLAGNNAGLRALFQRYQGQVKKMILYDPEKDWTWYLALMAAAQQDGIPVTEALRKELASEFSWNGEVEDFGGRWANRLQAYDWAFTNLMPHCTKQVVFALRSDMPLTDYAVASRGFVFWLDFNSEQAEVRKILQTKGYGVGTALMGYASNGDEANATANRYGIGYVVSDFYANGSFWSAFPDKTYTQSRGRAVTAEPGKIYAHIMWSDGDNIQFDQNPLYLFWHDPARGQIPVATQLSPTLLRLNPPLLDWYYAKLTATDELVAGPTGVQFIFIRDFRDDQFPAWCRMNRVWCAGAGFHSARIWIAPNPSVKYSTYMTSCGLDGLFGEGWSVKAGFPPKVDTYGAANEEELFKQFMAVKPNPQAPVFCGFTPIVGGFNRPNGGYSALKRQVDRLEKALPGRYVFLLPKDQFATIKAYLGANQPEVVGRPGATDGLTTPVTDGDGEFTIVERDGTRCWQVPKSRNLYLRVPDSFRPQPGKPLDIELEYLDVGSGEIVLEYDSTDIQAPLGGAYKKHPSVIRRGNRAQWQLGRFRVTDAGFGGSQNGGTDFRFYNGGDDLLIRVVRARRVGAEGR